MPSSIFTGNITYSVWFKWTLSTSGVIIMQGVGGSGTYRLTMEQNTGFPFLWYTNSSGVGMLVYKSAVRQTAVWNHCVWTRNSTTSKLNVWMNGVRVATNVSDNGAASPNTSISIQTAVNNTIKVSKVRVWNRVFTDAEVQELYRKDKFSRIGLQLEWLFNEGGGTTAYDTSGNGYNGTISSMTYNSDVPMAPRKTAYPSVRNGDFEISPTFVAAQTGNNWIDGTATGSSTNDAYGWYSSTNATTSVRFDTTVSHSGSKSIKISQTAGSGSVNVYNFPGTWNATNSKWLIPIKPSTIYTYSFWYKLDVTSAVTGFIPKATLSTADFTNTSKDGSAITSTTNWTQYSLTFTSGANDVWFTPFFRLTNCVMNAWVDDVILKEVTSGTITSTTRTKATGRSTASGRSAA